MQGIYASRTAQSIRSEEKSTIPFFFFFFISFCPWNALSRGIVSLAARCDSVCCNYYRAQCVRWLEIDLNKDSEWGGGGGEKIRRCLLYTGRQKGAEKSVAKERGQPEPALHARGLLWEKELTGRRSAASSSQTTAAQKEETSWGCCDMSRSFPISLFHLSASLPSHRADTRQTHVQHAAFPTFTRILLSQWHTHTHTHTHTCTHSSGACGLWDS